MESVTFESDEGSCFAGRTLCTDGGLNLNYALSSGHLWRFSIEPHADDATSSNALAQQLTEKTGYETTAK
jgi:hypothetical protein